MVGMVSRILFGIEFAVVLLLAGVMAVITAFVALGISNLAGVLYFIAFAVVCLALVATAEIAFGRVRGGGEDAPGFGLRSAIAIVGAVISTGLTIYGRLFLSANERWVEGLDFIFLGCFLWVPLFHLAVLEIVGLTGKRE